MRSEFRLFDGSYTGRPEPGGARWLVLALAAAAIGLATLFVGGEYLQRLVRYLQVREPAGVVQAVSLIEPVRNIALNTLAEVPLTADGLVAGGLPLRDLRMAPKDWQQIQATARIVTARVIAEGVVRDYVPAEFWRDGQWTPIQVKLRGLYAPHYLMKRPSLRLKFPADRPFEGKRQLNLLDLYDKGLTYDVTTNWELRRHGVMTWQSQFVALRLNGKVLGLYQEIEQFGRSLSDRNRRPEGFILSGRGQLFGKPTPGVEKALAAFQKMASCHLTPPSPLCGAAFQAAYFDLDRWAWAGGMMLLLQSRHGWASDNMRVFWDPAFGHFEPIPWDYQIFPVDPLKRADGEVSDESYALSFASIPEYRRLRDQHLWTLVTERVEPMIAEADRLFRELSPALSHDLRHITLAEDERLQARYPTLLRENARYLKALFEGQRLGVRWWPTDESGRATLEISNQGKAFVSIRAVLVARDGRRQRVEFEKPLVVDGVFRSVAGRAVAHVVLEPDDRVVGLAARNAVTGAELRSSEIGIFPKQGRPPEPSPSFSPPPVAAVPRGVRVESDRVVIGPGRVVLARTLEIDASREVVLAPGLDLKMAAGVSLIVYGDFHSVGTASDPILISGALGTERWGGVLVHGRRSRPSQVRVEYTTFEGGFGGETERIRFTAPFAVHAGVVRLRHLRLLNGRAEDAINLKYSEVDVAEVEIRGARDDAFDCDFCSGTLARVRIRDVGGDGLDFSGSDLRLEETAISGCGDKGVSIGEATRIRLTETRIENCYTGIAVKDLSQADIRDVSLSRLEVGVALYVKKPSFGPSRARVEGARLHDVATRVLRDELCLLEWVD